MPAIWKRYPLAGFRLTMVIEFAVEPVSAMYTCIPCPVSVSSMDTLKPFTGVKVFLRGNHCMTMLVVVISRALWSIIEEHIADTPIQTVEGC